MGYLALEIIALLAGAAVLGIVLGWAIFGLGKKVEAPAGPGLALANPKADADVKAALDARKKAEARIVELEAKESNFTERLQERDTKVAELSHQLDELAKYRVVVATEKEQKDQRIAALEQQLRQRDADIASLQAGGGGGGSLELQAQVNDRDRHIARLKAENETLAAAASPDAPKVKELQAEIAELRATLVATAGAAPTTASEKDAIIGRLNEEVTGLRAAYEAAEQALEEQDAAIDKLTRELVEHQRKVATLEGREAPLPKSGVTARPVTGSGPLVVPAASPTTTTGNRPMSPAPAAAPQAPTTQIDTNERTVAISIADYVAKVDAAPPAPAAPVAQAVSPTAEANESTIAIPLAELVSQIDQDDTVSDVRSLKKADIKPASPPPMQVDVNESTVAISIADLVAQVDQTPAKPIPAPVPAPAPVPPTPPPMQVEVNESTVAISLADLVAQVDAGPAKPPPVQVEANERTVAFVLPADLADEDDEPAKLSDSNDLKRIKGIGKATAKRLRSAGITTWSQVANLTDADLPQIADLLKVSVDKIKPWVEQAKALRQGS